MVTFSPIIPTGMTEGQWHRCSFRFIADKDIDANKVIEVIFDGLSKLSANVYVDYMSVQSDREISKFPTEEMLVR